MTMAAASRLAVSPYARRLARERNLPLAALHGSGPGGRILAADVLTFVPADAPVELPASVTQPVAAPSIAAFATSIAFGPVHELLGALHGAGHIFDVEDVILRATDCAFAAIAQESQVDDPRLALEIDGRQVVLAGLSGLPLTALRTLRLQAQAGSRDDANEPASLSIRLLPPGDIRPVMMPLLPGRTMRLTVSVGTAGDRAEFLLTTDVSKIDEAASCTWLAALKSAVEHPLRLFV